MGIIGFVYSTNTRVVDQPIYMTCRTRKRRLRACAEPVEVDVCFLFTTDTGNVTQILITLIFGVFFDNGAKMVDNVMKRLCLLEKRHMN